MGKTEEKTEHLKSDQERKKPTGRNNSEFYEMMPNAYADPPTLFPTVNDQSEDLTEDEVRRRMVRQLGMLLVLLILQFVLFAVLIQSTVNLG